jgi:hypothetical protein
MMQDQKNNFTTSFKDININEYFIYEACPFIKVDANHAAMMVVDKNNKEYFDFSTKVIKFI